MRNSQSPLIQRDGGVGISLATQLDVFSVEVPVPIKPINWNIWFIWDTDKTLLKFGCLWQTDYSRAIPLTLNIEGDTVGEDLLVVRGDTGERLLVCLSAGHQNVVTLHRERPVKVPVLSGGHFSWHARLPPVCTEETELMVGVFGVESREKKTQTHNTPDGCGRLPIGRHTGGHRHFQIGRPSH